MLRPIIILENHLDATPTDFLVKNMSELKGLGYKKLLLEMNMEVSLGSFIMQNRIIANSDSLPHYLQNKAKAVLRMIESAKSAGLAIEFIDPQTQKEAGNEASAVSQARTAEHRASALQKIDHSKVKRDIIMSQKIISEIHECDGGIISINGFMHNSLIMLINEYLGRNPEFNIEPCFLIISNFFSHLVNRSSGSLVWEKLRDKSYRNDFYKSEVLVIENSGALSFEYFESMLRLSESKDVDQSYIGYLFNRTLGVSAKYTVDRLHVTSASIEVARKEERDDLVSVLKCKFPGLYFSTSNKPELHKIYVPGLNLPENNKLLSQSFEKAGVMKRHYI